MMWEQRNKPVGNEDPKKEASGCLRKQKTGGKKGGGKGGQKRSESRNLPIRAESHVECHCTISLGLEDSSVMGHKLCRDMVTGQWWLPGGTWYSCSWASPDGAQQPCGSWDSDLSLLHSATHKQLGTTKPTGKHTHKNVGAFKVGKCPAQNRAINVLGI